MKQELIIISLGGSLIVPKEGIDVKFLKKFRAAILSLCRQGHRFILICGGGSTARAYQGAAKKLINPNQKTLDQLGIEITHINAHLVRMIFGKAAHPEVVKDPTKKLNFKEKVLIGAGWKPGCSTDYDAVLLAKTYGAKRIINLTNIDYLCDKNPMIYKDAKKIKQISWAGFRKIVGNKWIPGANTPFDPVASRGAQKLKLELILANGKRLENLRKIVRNDKKIIGSAVN